MTWAVGTAMPAAGYELATCGFGGKLYVWSPDGTVARKFDPSTSTWSTIALPPGALNSPNAVPIGSYIWLLGIDHGTLYRYDPSANTYADFSSGVPAYAVHSFVCSAGTDGSKLYVNVSPDFGPFRIWVYDPTANTWDTTTIGPITTIPAASWIDYGGLFVINNEIIFVVGSWYDGATRFWDGSVARWDLTTNTGWVAGTSAPDHYSNFNPTISGTPVAIVMGGDNAGGAGPGTTHVQAYDPVTDKWLEAPALIQTRTYSAAAYDGSNVYCLGGIINSGATATAEVEVAPLIDFIVTKDSGTATESVSLQYFFDDFTRADNAASLGGSWTAQVGTWGISSNQAQLESTVNQIAIATVDVGVPDYVIDGDIKCVGFDSQLNTGLIVRYLDSSNYAYLKLSNTNWWLYTNVAGTLTVVSGAGVFDFNGGGSGTTQHIQLICKGKRIQFWGAGVLLADCEGPDPDPGDTNHLVGLAGNGSQNASGVPGGAKFDNIKVTRPAPDPTFPTWLSVSSPASQYFGATGVAKFKFTLGSGMANALSWIAPTGDVGSGAHGSAEFDVFSADPGNANEVTPGTWASRVCTATIANSFNNLPALAAGTYYVVVSLWDAPSPTYYNPTPTNWGTFHDNVASADINSPWSSIAEIAYVPPVIVNKSASDAGTVSSSTRVGPAVSDSGVASETASLSGGVAISGTDSATTYLEYGSVVPSIPATPTNPSSPAPGVVATVRWAFVDPQGQIGTYLFEINPNKMTDPTLKKVTQTFGISPVRGVSRAWRQNANVPRQWTFSGVTLSQDQHTVFETWYALNRRIWLRDHFGRVFEVRLLKYAPEPRKPTKKNEFWRFQYTFTANVYRRVS